MAEFGFEGSVGDFSSKVATTSDSSASVGVTYQANRKLAVDVTYKKPYFKNLQTMANTIMEALRLQSKGTLAY